MKKIAINFLYDLIEIKSYDQEGKKACCELIKKELDLIGFDTRIINGYGSPIIMAVYDVGAEENIVFYSHYDVKPEGDISKWHTDPFVPFYNSCDNKIYARGSGDDKGQLYCVIQGIKEMLSTGHSPKYNVTILIEGDEESGSPKLDIFCKNELQETEYKAIIINDSHWLNDKPIVCLGTRGQMTIKIIYDVSDMKESLHAGNYGGLKIGAARPMLNILAEILNEIGKIINTNPSCEEKFGNAISLTYLNAGDPIRSLIPKQCTAKIDIRYVVPKVAEEVVSVIDKITKKYGIGYEIEQNEEGYYNKADLVMLNVISTAIKEVTNIEPLIEDYSGAYLPMNKLEHIKGKKYVIPFAQSDEHNHAPNENISLRHIEYGIEIIKKLIE